MKLLVKKSPMRWSKLHSAGLEDQFWGKSFFFLISSRFPRLTRRFSAFCGVFWQGRQNCIQRVQKNIWGEKSFSKRRIFLFAFGQSTKISLPPWKRSLPWLWKLQSKCPQEFFEEFFFFEIYLFFSPSPDTERSIFDPVAIFFSTVLLSILHFTCPEDLFV